jgi:hypothetical protein
MKRAVGAEKPKHHKTHMSQTFFVGHEAHDSTKMLRKIHRKLLQV